MLRLEEAEKIGILDVREESDVARGLEEELNTGEHNKKRGVGGKTARTKIQREKHHPGLGEGGKYHNKREENPIPEGEMLTF